MRSAFKLGSVAADCGGEVLKRQGRRLRQKFDHALEEHASKNGVEVVLLNKFVCKKNIKG